MQKLNEYLSKVVEIVWWNEIINLFSIFPNLQPKCIEAQFEMESLEEKIWQQRAHLTWQKNRYFVMRLSAPYDIW